MKPRIRKVFLLLSALVILGLLLSACAPAAQPTPAPVKAPEVVAPTPPPVKPPPAPPEAAAKPRYGGVLVNVTYKDLHTFDAQRSTDRPVLYGLAGPMGSGIIQFDPMEQDKIIGDLAERWEVSPDGKVYTFYFRKGVKWHDGRPFTADDAKFTMDRARIPPKGMPSPRQDAFAVAEDIQVVDKDTLKVILKYPSASFLDMLATGWNIMLPRHLVEPLGGKEISRREFIGTGPFVFQEYINGVSVEWTRNKDYFMPGRPYLDGMKLYIMPDDAARHAAFRTGRIHVTELLGTGMAPSDVASIKRMRPDAAVQKGLTFNHPNLGMNTKRKPFDDPRVRKAIFLAIDRQAGNQVIQQNEGFVGGPFPPTSFWALPQEEVLRMPGYRQPKDQDLAEAKRLLAEAGYPNGFKTTMLARPGKLNQDTAVFFEDQLRRLGIEAQIKNMEVGGFVASMNARSFDLYEWAQAILIDDPDQVFGELYVSKGFRNYEQHVVSGLDELFDKQSRELDPAKRKEMALQMQRMVLENPAKAIAVWPSLFVAFAPEVKDYRVSQRGVQNNSKFQDVWLAQSE